MVSGTGQGSDGFRHWERWRFGAGFRHRNLAFSGIGFLDLESTLMSGAGILG
jgi:hypothetical protein